jgi:hypothetical protein
MPSATPPTQNKGDVPQSRQSTASRVSTKKENEPTPRVFEGAGQLTPIGHASSVKIGIIPAAIWIEDPTETPMVSSILPFMAIQTEVTCSAACQGGYFD